MSWTSPLTVASTMRPLPAVVDLLHVRLEVGDRGLHRLGRLQHERQLHLAGAEQLADDLHARQQDVVDDRRAAACRRRGPRRGRRSRPSRSPSMMRWRQALLDRPAGAVLLDHLGGLDVREHGQEPVERVVVGVGAVAAGGAAAVVDQVEADLALLLGDAGQRHDPGRVDDGRVEAGLDALVQEHRVEDVAGGRLEAEGDVGQAERGVDAGQLGLDAPDGLDGGDAVAAEVLVAGRRAGR